MKDPFQISRTPGPMSAKMSAIEPLKKACRSTTKKWRDQCNKLKRQWTKKFLRRPTSRSVSSASNYSSRRLLAKTWLIMKGCWEKVFQEVVKRSKLNSSNFAKLKQESFLSQKFKKLERNYMTTTTNQWIWYKRRSISSSRNFRLADPNSTGHRKYLPKLMPKCLAKLLHSWR